MVVTRHQRDRQVLTSYGKCSISPKTLAWKVETHDNMNIFLIWIYSFQAEMMMFIWTDEGFYMVACFFVISSCISVNVWKCSSFRICGEARAAHNVGGKGGKGWGDVAGSEVRWRASLCVRRLRGFLRVSLLRFRAEFLSGCWQVGVYKHLTVLVNNNTCDQCYRVTHSLNTK